MPELPEVEQARAVIAERALGREIVDVDDTDAYVCRPHAAGEIKHAIIGRELVDAHRQGKFLWTDLSGDDGPELALHLGMSGRIVVDAADGERFVGPGTLIAAGPPTTAAWDRFTLRFADGGALYLRDKRRLGRVRLDPDRSGLGPDAAEATRAQFRAAVGRGTAPLKARLLDQSVVAGVGNLLADEVLWQAGLSPHHPAGELTHDELDALRRQLRASTRRAIRLGGVHHGEVMAARKRGAHCPRCGAPMRRETVGGRTTFWCPTEQR